MFVLGIDPGLSRCGYCALDLTQRVPSVRSIGVIRTPTDAPLPHRLAELQRDVRGVLAEIRPSVVAVERVLFQVNVRTAMQVSNAAGVVMAEAAAAGAEVIEYSPNQVKRAVAGHGDAGKHEVGEMVRRLLGLASIPRPADASDAAAIALCFVAYHGTVAAGRSVRTGVGPSTVSEVQR